MSAFDLEKIKNNPMSMDKLELYCPPNMVKEMQTITQGLYHIPGIDLDKPLTILDIGANVGAFTKWCYFSFPRCTIHSYEPNPKAATIFRSNCPDLKLHQVAITTKKAKRVRLYKGINNMGECSLIKDTQQKDDYVMVDSLHPRKLPPADFVKLDTEGSEVEILQEYLKKCLPRGIAVECHGITNIHLMVAMLRDDYKLYSERRWNFKYSVQLWRRKDFEL